MAKKRPVSAKVEKDIGYLNHVHDDYLARYPEYEGLTTNDGKTTSARRCRGGGRG